MRRTQGATIATVGNAIGHVLMQLKSHSVKKPGCKPRVVTSTKPDTMQTMIADNNALNRTGAKRVGIRMGISS
jgi:hypothetical protein